MVNGITCRANRSQGIARAAPAVRIGSVSRTAGVIAGCSRGSLRKYQAQTTSHNRLAAPNIANVPRQVENSSNPAMIGGVTALPIRAKECTIPCANPQLPCGVQLAIARVAVGKPAPSPNPSASRNRISDAIPVTAPVSAVDIPTSAQQIASVSLGPSQSPIQPPINWNKAYGIAKAENASPSCVLLILRSALISGAAVEILTRSTKYRKYIAQSSASTTVGAPSLPIRMPRDASRS